MPQAATTKSLARAFRMMKAMQAQGIEWGEDYRRVGALALKDILEGRMAAGIDCHPEEMAARRFADRWHEPYPKAVDCLRADLDELLTCFRYKTLEERKAVRTTNAIERRFREVRRRTRPMGVFQDRTSMDRILFAVFTHETQTREYQPSSL